MITLLLFAGPREAAGVPRIDLEPDSAGRTVGALWSEACDRQPALSPWRKAVMFARNGEYCSAGDQIADGDELAVIPPVSGG